MKLLFDQNISPKLITRVENLFPGSQQVVHLGLQDASDLQIFEFARENQFAVVTFDSDFVDLSIVKGTPPKIIWLRTGNLTTRSIHDLIRMHEDDIRAFLISETGILEILKRDL